MAIAGTYGRGQMLGAGVDPSLFRQDYSGFAKAGEIQGQAYADLGKSIGSAITGFADIKKQNAALKAQTQSDVDFAKSAQGLYKDSDPERAGALAQSIEALNDPGLNAYEKAALASGLRQNISDGFKLQQMQSAMQMQRQRMSQMGGGGGGQVAPAAKFVPKF
jgi:hypothetical protein